MYFKFLLNESISILISHFFIEKWQILKIFNVEIYLSEPHEKEFYDESDYLKQPSLSSSLMNQECLEGNRGRDWMEVEGINQKIYQQEIHKQKLMKSIILPVWVKKIGNSDFYLQMSIIYSNFYHRNELRNLPLERNYSSRVPILNLQLYIT